MAEPRCQCCDLPAYSCGKATEDRQRRERRAERERLLGLPGWFAAEYPGVCAECGEYFEAGIPIRRETDNGRLGWRAWCCASLGERVSCG